MLSVNPPTQCSGTPSDTRLSVNPFVVAQGQRRERHHLNDTGSPDTAPTPTARPTTAVFRQRKL